MHSHSHTAFEDFYNNENTEYSQEYTSVNSENIFLNPKGLNITCNLVQDGIDSYC